MSRIVFFALSLFASLLVAFAAPIANTPAQLVERTTHTGQGTWFEVGLGNCGLVNKDSDHIVAIAKSQYDANGGANCGQWVQITHNGHTAYGLTRDSCPSCGPNDLDMSPSLFQALSPLSAGRIDISWHFMNKGFKP